MKSDMNHHEQREVYYSGRVQGVGFRYTAQHLARQFAVTGYVRNLPDGRVHLVAEGSAEEVVGLLDAIRSTFGPAIHHVEEMVCPATGRFTSFDIRF